MSKARKVFAVAVLVALAWAVAPVAEAQPPIRIGGSLSQTGSFAAPGPEPAPRLPALRQAHERKRRGAVIVWPEELAPDKARFPTPPWSQR